MMLQFEQNVKQKAKKKKKKVYNGFQLQLYFSKKYFFRN